MDTTWRHRPCLCIASCGNKSCSKNLDVSAKDETGHCAVRWLSLKFYPSSKLPLQQCASFPKQHGQLCCHSMSSKCAHYLRVWTGLVPGAGPGLVPGAGPGLVPGAGPGLRSLTLLDCTWNTTDACFSPAAHFHFLKLSFFRRFSAGYCCNRQNKTNVHKCSIMCSSKHMQSCCLAQHSVQNT